MLNAIQRQGILADVVKYVEQLFAENLKEALVYHSLQHTKDVVEHAAEIAEHCQLTDDDLSVLLIAAWFHDTGQLFAEQKNHEEASIQVVNKFLNIYPEISQQTIAQVERCILATKMPQVPCTLLEDILCDADTYHLGTPEFVVTNELVRRETDMIGGDTSDWTSSTLRLLQAHVYHTEYCQTKLSAGKQQNIDNLKLTDALS